MKQINIFARAPPGAYLSAMMSFPLADFFALATVDT